jgi:putative membrane protein
MGEWHAEVLLGLAATAIGYAWAARAQRRRPSGGRILALAAGLATFAFALNGPIHDLSDGYLFSAHMVQHLLITLVGPPLLLAGLEPGMLRPLLGRPAVARAVAGLTRLPVAFTLYNVALVAWHLPGPYNAALEHHGLHVVEHLTFIGTALLAWWPILAPEPALPGPPYGLRMLYLFLMSLPMTAVAAFVTLAESPLYPFYAAAPRVWDLSPLDDQRLGGVIMWVPATLAPLVAFTGVFFRWVAAEDE